MKGRKGARGGKISKREGNRDEKGEKDEMSAPHVTYVCVERARVRGFNYSAITTRLATGQASRLAGFDRHCGASLRLRAFTSRLLYWVIRSSTMELARCGKVCVNDPNARVAYFARNSRRKKDIVLI